MVINVIWRLQEDIEAARPCLTQLVSKLGDETLSKVLRGMMPLALKCGQEFIKQKDMDETTKKRGFVDCVTHEGEAFMQKLSPDEKQAFEEAKQCAKALFDDVV